MNKVVNDSPIRIATLTATQNLLFLTDVVVSNTSIKRRLTSDERGHVLEIFNPTFRSWQNSFRPADEVSIFAAATRDSAVRAGLFSDEELRCGNDASHMNTYRGCVLAVMQYAMQRFNDGAALHSQDEMKKVFPQGGAFRQSLVFLQEELEPRKWQLQMDKHHI